MSDSPRWNVFIHIEDALLCLLDHTETFYYLFYAVTGAGDEIMGGKEKLQKKWLLPLLVDNVWIKNIQPLP